MKICEFKESPIHGKGIFALQQIEKGTLLFQTHQRSTDVLCWVNLKPNCLYNHSTKANCISKTDGDSKFLVACEDIEKGSELLVDYTKDTDLEQPHKEWNE